MAIHPGFLAWKFPLTVEPGGLQSMGAKESDMNTTEHTYVNHFINLTPSPLEPIFFMLSSIVRCNKNFHTWKRLIFSLIFGQFKARATDQLVSLDNPLMSSSYLGHDDKRFLRLRLSSTGGS